MKAAQLLVDITAELNRCAKKVNDDELKAAVDEIVKAKRIYVAGSGRSGFVARAFANRMMHLGLQMYFVGDTTTPSIRKGDLLFVISGSGETASHVSNVAVAKREGARVVTITIFPEHTIGKQADQVIVLPGVTSKAGKDDQINETSIQPMGNMFEQLSFLTCDTIAICLMEKLKQTQDQMHYRHANME